MFRLCDELQQSADCFLRGLYLVNLSTSQQTRQLFLHGAARVLPVLCLLGFETPITSSRCSAAKSPPYPPIE